MHIILLNDTPTDLHNFHILPKNSICELLDETSTYVHVRHQGYNYICPKPVKYNIIKLPYEKQDKLEIKDGNLHITLNNKEYVVTLDKNNRFIYKEPENE